MRGRCGRQHGDAGGIFLLALAVDVQGVDACGGFVVGQGVVAFLALDRGHADEVGAVVVVIACSGTDERVALLGIGGVVGKETEELVVVHLLEHAVAAQVEIVARSHVGNVDDVGLHAVVAAGCDGACDDVLLRRGVHLDAGDFAGLIEVHHQGVVTRDVAYFASGGPQVIDAAVANVCRRDTATVQAQQGERGAHLAFTAGVACVEQVVGVCECVVEQLVGERLVVMVVAGDVVAHRLCHGGAGHLAVLVAAHAVAHDEQALGLGGAAGGGEDGVLLVAALAKLMDGLWGIEFKKHRGVRSEEL